MAGSPCGSLKLSANPKEETRPARGNCLRDPVTIGVMDTSWMARGKCKDQPPDQFFPSDGVGVEVARRICADCPVKSPCLEYAMANHIDHGVWGGTSERERRRIARRRRLAAAATSG
jgi:WhiB family redox-sensing transcriptional regulator